MTAYRSIPESVTGLEEEILRRWDEENTFSRSLEARREAEDFVFFEGPPTANGLPGVHHLLGRTIKDLLARYRTMVGYRVDRVAGWDTHGLPVELETEKRLGISGKPQIEALGIARFNEVCRENIFTYQDEWEKLSRRIGYWLDYDDPYVTCSPDYIESVWWALSEIERRGLLYRGHRIVPYCPRCGTGLSSHEVALGYHEVVEPAVYVKFHLIDDPDDASILSWTTTPWTLPGNLALAVGSDITYARVRVTGEAPEGARPHDGPGGATPGEVLVLAEDLVEDVLRHDYEVMGTLKGRELVGGRYEALFPGAVDGAGSKAAWSVLDADFVTVEEGTGVVHTAVMYGEDDYRLGAEVGLPMQHTVGEDGRFVDDVPGGLAGADVKAAETERAIREWLVEHDLLYLREMYEHSYPHCWRCDHALLYMARHSWYIETTAVKDRLIANNASVDWHPPEIGSGRMGAWLENNVDWALSRERYWGTPLPIWICSEEESHREVLGSYAALAERVGGLSDDFDPHRPEIDELGWDCREVGCGGHMARIPEVADAWFDSGSMPFAQWHYPFENEEAFERHFPADYIAEGLDQTRGWFYSLLAISTILFDRSPYRTVVVNDLVLDASGQKMSKSRGNVLLPSEAIEAYGADVIRFYLMASSNPWVPKRWDPAGLRDTDRKLFATLRHTYRFFSLYANEEGWHHAEGDGPPLAERTKLDRWILARLDRLVAAVRKDLEGYDLTAGARRIQGFVLDDLSNWYVRRSRDRFWATRPGALAAETASAFATLRECLLVVTRLLAPFAPFASDWLHRALGDDASVHLADFPSPAGHEEPDLERGMDDVRRLATLGRAAREEAGVRTRQPLSALHAVLPGGRRLDADMTELLADELNVKTVEFLSQSGDLIRLSAKPRFGTLGPKHGARTPEVAKAVSALGGGPLERLRDGETVEIEVESEAIRVDPDDVEIIEEADTELAMASSDGYVAALDTTLDEALVAEGLARELVNRVQRLRRDGGLEVADRIRLGIAGPGEVEEAAKRHEAYIAGETLASELLVGASGLEQLNPVEVDIAERVVMIGVERVAR